MLPITTGNSTSNGPKSNCKGPLGGGRKIVPTIYGPADLNSFDLLTHEISSTPVHPAMDPKRAKLEKLYAQVREFRERAHTAISLNKVFEEITDDHPSDWLLSVELYELAKRNNDFALAKEILQHLETVKHRNPKIGNLIDDGLELTEKKKGSTYGAY